MPILQRQYRARLAKRPLLNRSRNAVERFLSLPSSNTSLRQTQIIDAETTHFFLLRHGSRIREILQPRFHLSEKKDSHKDFRNTSTAINPLFAQFSFIVLARSVIKKLTPKSNLACGDWISNYYYKSQHISFV